MSTLVQLLLSFDPLQVVIVFAFGQLLTACCLVVVGWSLHRSRQEVYALRVEVARRVWPSHATLWRGGSDDLGA